MTLRRPLLAGALVAVCFLTAGAFAVSDPYDRSNVPIEAQPTDPSAAKIVLIAGDAGTGHPAGEHEHFAGCALLMRLLQQTPGVAPVMVQNGWPTNPETLKNARTLVFYMDGGGKQTTIAHAAEIQKLMDAGVGIVHLHQVIDYPTGPGEQAMHWLGGVYDAKAGGARGHWDESFTEFPQSEVTRGVGPFKVNDGWILKLKFVPGMKGITPILRTTQLSPKGKPDKPITGSENIVCWTYDRPDGGRSFVLTGAHPHRNWGVESFRRLVVNGILWTAKVEVPKEGAPVKLDPADLFQNMERKPAKAAKTAKAATK
ncbi:MAG TPA: ThuA domain-containing protein [Tepidisphaeraceae bacterium]|nr:ThuA domain-containing protein [Tepidisphaeraceae bacterium]